MLLVEDLLGSAVVTAAEFDRMTPQQVEEAWSASIITEPHLLPGEYVETIRRRAEQRLAQRDV